MKALHSELEKVLGDGLGFEQEKQVLENWLHGRPEMAPAVIPLLLQQKHLYRQMAQDYEQKLQEPPWHPGAFLRLLPNGRAFVASGSRRFGVAVAPGVDPTNLSYGRPVFLNGALNLLVETVDELPRPGSVGEFSRFHGPRRAVLRGQADEEVVVDLADELLNVGIKKQDLVLYDRETYIAYEKIENRHEQAMLLEELRLETRIEDLAGLDHVFHKLVDEVKLQLLHPDLVERYRMKPMRGVVLSGPPGTGKTSLVQAAAEFLKRQQNIEIRAFRVPPGAHRSKWFGDSEKRVQDIFLQAKQAVEADQAFALLFFDDMDHLGSRESRFAGDVDARLLPCFLQEIDSLGKRLMLVGATNREDLLDEALMRPGRFGRVFRIPRPSRSQARQIFQRHLHPDLPLLVNGGGREAAAEAFVDFAVAAMYAPNGEFSTLATLVFRDGSRRPLRAAEVISGALIAEAVEEVKRRSVARLLQGEPEEIVADDLYTAVGGQITSLAQRLRPGPTLRQMLDLPQDLDVVKVEVALNGRSPRSELRQ